MLQHVRLIGIQCQLLQNQRVALDCLCRRKAHGKLRFFCMVLDQMDHRMDAAVHRTAVVAPVAKILLERMLLIFCNMDRMLHQLVHALIFCRRNRDNGHPEQRLHAVYIDRPVISDHLIHHVQRDQHRNIHLQKLHRQI